MVSLESQLPATYCPTVPDFPMDTNRKLSNISFLKIKILKIAG